MGHPSAKISNLRLRPGQALRRPPTLATSFDAGHLLVVDGSHFPRQGYMHRTPVLSLVLLGCALWLHAQEGDPGGDRWKVSHSPTLQGCLENSGGYYLTQKDGTQTRLEDGNHLSQYVGHEVEVNGTPRIITLDTTEDGAASTVEEFTIFYVSNVKDLAPQCTADTS